jgi:hypothetical protein
MKSKRGKKKKVLKKRAEIIFPHIFLRVQTRP